MRILLSILLLSFATGCMMDGQMKSKISGTNLSSEYVGGPTTSTTTTTQSGPTGAQLFATHCASCHTAAQKNGRTPTQIQNAINGNPAGAWPSMNTSSLHALTTSQIQLISAFLGGYATTSSTTTSSTTTSTMAGGLDGRVLFETYCTSCHYHTPESLSGRSSEQIRTAINTQPQMTGLSGLTNPQLEAIESYLQGTTPTIPSATSLSPTGTSRYMADYLTKIFVSNPSTDAAIVTKINNLVGKQSGAFGGPVTRYDAQISQYNAVTPYEVPVLPLTGAVRKGYLLRVCTELVGTDSAVDNALTKANLTAASPVNDTNVRLLYGKFYPGRATSSSAASALVNVGTQGASLGLSGRNLWRFVLLPLCASNNGEIL